MKNLLFILFSITLLASCSPKAEQNTSEAATTEAATTPIDHAAYRSPNGEVQQRVFDYMMQKGVFYIATMDGDQPRVRPFGALHIFEGKLYIITGHVKRVSKQLAVNPKVELCAQGNNEWVRVAATLVEDERVEAKKAVLDAYPHLRSSYNENDDNIAVYYLTNATATFSSFSQQDETVTF